MSARWDVLVVDDEPVVCDGIRRVLEAHELRVATAATAADALGHPALQSCRLVLVDLMLPESSGLDLLRSLRARRPDLRAIVITGYATQESAIQAAGAGAFAFLPKPFDETELMTQVRHALGPRDATREEERT
jgi:DNA-binding NtrC family response regulator